MTDVLVPATYTRADVVAIQALARGEADAEQQKRAFFWITRDLCRVNDVVYRPGSFDETACIAGQRFVGTQILDMLRVKVSTLET